jgi:hypothetical protein
MPVFRRDVISSNQDDRFGFCFVFSFLLFVLKSLCKNKHYHISAVFSLEILFSGAMIFWGT